MDYRGVKIVLDDAETRMEILRKLDDAAADAGRRIVYFSCLQ